MREGRGEGDSLVVVFSLSSVVSSVPKHSHQTLQGKQNCSQLDVSEFSGNTDSLGFCGVPSGSPIPSGLSEILSNYFTSVPERTSGKYKLIHLITFPVMF